MTNKDFSHSLKEGQERNRIVILVNLRLHVQITCWSVPNTFFVPCKWVRYDFFMEVWTHRICLLLKIQEYHLQTILSSWNILWESCWWRMGKLKLIYKDTESIGENHKRLFTLWSAQRGKSETAVPLDTLLFSAEVTKPVCFPTALFPLWIESLSTTNTTNFPFVFMHLLTQYTGYFQVTDGFIHRNGSVW